MSNDNEYKKTCKRFRYRVLTYTFNVSGKAVERYMIVLAEIRTGLIVKYTDYADYVLYRTYDDIDVYRADSKSVYTLASFLNYVFIENIGRYGIWDIRDLTREMFQDYLDEYASTRLKSGNYPSKQAVSDKRIALCTFGYMLCHYKKDSLRHLKKNAFIRHTVRNGQRYGKAIVPEYMLKVKIYDDRAPGELVSLMRDMPIQLAERFLYIAETRDPELCFPIALQLYGGLRSGEVCNVRRKESIYGPGILLQTNPVMDARGITTLEAISMQIDLRHEYIMRSDGITVGRIKKERMVSIYGPFTGKLYDYYIRHLSYIKDKPYEGDAAPMFLNANKTGDVYKAMTSDAYRKRVKTLFYDYVLPSCEGDDDPDLARFCLQMMGHTWGLHAFRHWFTVNLLYCGVDDQATLMHLRGDSSPESAATYLKNKGVLMATYRTAVERMANSITGCGRKP